MPSPFPGMDPYIESCRLWDDLQPNLMSEIQAALADRLPDRYVARLGERSYVVLMPADELDGGSEDHSMAADVSINLAAISFHQTESATAVLEMPMQADQPITMWPLIEMEFREVFVEISEFNPDWRLVTTIEVLSPTNKRRNATGTDLYQRKRQAHMLGAANLVEIDLLRRGRRLPMEQEWPESPFYVVVCRKTDAPRCQVWPAGYLHPLPKIAIPLTAPDPDVVIDLQPMIASVYRRSRYETDIDFKRPCSPRLPDEDQK